MVHQLIVIFTPKILVCIFTEYVREKEGVEHALRDGVLQHLFEEVGAIAVGDGT